MEARKLKVVFNKDGRGVMGTKMSLPITHFRNMGITEEDREVNYYYDEENEIMILSKKELNNIDIKVN